MSPALLLLLVTAVQCSGNNTTAESDCVDQRPQYEWFVLLVIAALGAGAARIIQMRRRRRRQTTHTLDTIPATALHTIPEMYSELTTRA